MRFLAVGFEIFWLVAPVLSYPVSIFSSGNGTRSVSLSKFFFFFLPRRPHSSNFFWPVVSLSLCVCIAQYGALSNHSSLLALAPRRSSPARVSTNPFKNTFLRSSSLLLTFFHLSTTSLCSTGKHTLRSLRHSRLYASLGSVDEHHRFPLRSTRFSSLSTASSAGWHRVQCQTCLSIGHGPCTR